MKNNLLLIFLAFVLGYTVSGAMNHMWGDLYEGVATSYCQRGWHMIDEPTEITNKDIQNKIGEGSIMVVEREDYTQMYCEKCPAGKYNNKNGSKSLGSCTDCKAGTYSSAGATKCIPCAAGHKSPAGATECTECDPGTYSSSGAAECRACPDGTINSGGEGCGSCVNTCRTNANGFGGQHQCTTAENLEQNRDPNECSLASVGFYSNSADMRKRPIPKTSDKCELRNKVIVADVLTRRADDPSVPDPVFSNTPVQEELDYHGNYCSWKIQPY